MDGERLPLPAKDLGSCDLYPQTLSHNPNGRFVTVCGDGEYIIYTALAWRNKSFGTAEEFVWGEDSSIYATRCRAHSKDPRQTYLSFEQSNAFSNNSGQTRGASMLLLCSVWAGRQLYDSTPIWDYGASVRGVANAHPRDDEMLPEGFSGVVITGPVQCREGTSTVKVFKNFKEVQTLKPGFSTERIFGGALLGVAGADFVCFYDWAVAKVQLSSRGCSHRWCLAIIEARAACLTRCFSM